MGGKEGWEGEEEEEEEMQDGEGGMGQATRGGTVKTACVQQKKEPDVTSLVGAKRPPA